jgi:HJR/Mrr/RecB family endonuclease
MMKRRYYRKNNELERSFTGIIVLAVIALLWYSYTNPITSITYILAAVVCALIFVFLRNWLRKKHFNSVLNKLKSLGQEDYIKNFISSFGLEGKKGEGYVFRNHKFEWDRINDLKKILLERGVTSREKDVFALLKFYIQEKEEAFTREFIRKEPQKFANMSGSDFEKLLYRLFEAMGYKVEWIGKSGDQGGDLIAVRDGERILIQAKCYRDWSTGNFAVQQVVGAMNHYNCNKTMVITTSHFTSEAITLAKDNKTELISKEQLQELLLKYTGESWY